jgi:F-type H+-transporting ATPase subunit gamma
MATLREVRARIVGVKKTQKITKAMKMVAAAKLRRAQSAIVSARPYARTLQEILQHLLAPEESRDHDLVRSREIRNVALLVISSDRGLCGAFNTTLLRAAVSHINTVHPAVHNEGKLRVFCAGKKAFDFFSRRHYKIHGKYLGVYNNLEFGQAKLIAQELIAGYRAGEFDIVEVAYNEFKSIAQQRVVIEQFLPVPVKDVPLSAAVQFSNYIFEPTSTEIITEMIPRYLDFQIWRMLLESNAAEQGARMAAMENATENAGEMISSLQLVYNKARQASITKELLEVVSGAEALEKAG